MKKETIWIIILFLFLTLSLSFFYLNFKISESNFELPYTHSYTKAICNETNFCEDYNIVCKEHKLLMMNPTGAVVQHDKNWKDPRKEEIENKNLCDNQ